MREKYLGDSFDIVKRFWADRLSTIAPLLAHPRFVPSHIRAAFEKMVAMPVLDLRAPPKGQFGLFLDPHTGIPLPSAAGQKPPASHAPLSFIEVELERLEARYLICFDQSHDRSCGLSHTQQRDRKRNALRVKGVASFYYVSHAPFLFAARDTVTLESVRRRLVESGIPAVRFESQ